VLTASNTNSCILLPISASLDTTLPCHPFTMFLAALGLKPPSEFLVDILADTNCSQLLSIVSWLLCISSPPCHVSNTVATTRVGYNCSQSTSPGRRRVRATGALVVFLLPARSLSSCFLLPERLIIQTTINVVVFVLPERLLSSCCRSTCCLLASCCRDRLIIQTTIRGSHTGATAGRGRIGEQWEHSSRSAAQHCYKEIARPTQLVKTLLSKSCWASLQSAGQQDFDRSIDDVCRLPFASSKICVDLRGAFWKIPYVLWYKFY
jgi:hypothetical protein